MARDTTHALSFGQNVGDYERGRPGYPDAAVEWMLAQSQPGNSPSDTEPTSGAAQLAVVDVGAGTGKFTSSLVARGLEVTAVEPDSVMRASLIRSYPTVTALQGTGESMPLPDASADLVTFAQAWHWVDVPEASAEVARVLKPSGRLALIWNIRDQSVDWVARLGEIMGSSAAEDYDSLTPPVGDALETVEHGQFFWDNPMSRDQLLAMITSRSYIIALEPEARAELLVRVWRLLDEHPQLAGHDTYVMPYQTRVTLARRA
ncbi:class I SAM-dependent methyltransferase [Subtercola lobariae]|uniref:Methyltransferase n=1 Tax=Subtercola lobariae TaxID=1588641 RepID=A0A917F289_9MICO|nr:class I SAM-dependent methyltransferase [Subtercola lobariae]GGF37619.1 putative methyltransferase [Subtercola lobariae]